MRDGPRHLLCMGAMGRDGKGQTSICTILLSIVFTAVSMFVICTHTKDFLPFYRVTGRIGN